jgi:hypothetical protein
MVKTEAIYLLVTNESECVSKQLGLTLVSIESYIGGAGVSAFTRDDLTKEVLNQAKDFTSTIRQAVADLNSEMEGTHLDDENLFDRYHDDICILNEILEWTYDEDNLIQMAHEDWDERELSKAEMAG